LPLGRKCARGEEDDDDDDDVVAAAAIAKSKSRDCQRDEKAAILELTV